MDYIIVNYKATNMTSNTGNYISGNAIDPETEKYPVTHEEE